MSPEQNKEIVKRFFDEACNQNKTEVIDNIFASPFLRNGKRAMPKEVKGFLKGLRKKYEKIEVRIDAQLAENDRVSTLRTWMAKVNDIRYEWKQISIVQLVKGKIVDDWVFEQEPKRVQG